MCAREGEREKKGRKKEKVCVCECVHNRKKLGDWMETINLEL